MAYSARVIADSLSPDGVCLTTVEATYPRFVHSELLTHRVFSRNSASSRAIPVEKMIQRVLEDPVLPVWWGKNQAGMQAREELQGDDLALTKTDWLEARGAAVARARSMHARGAHKQIVNRVLEPWMWITVLVSSTEWSNWDALRCHPDAQPELRRIAELMRDARAGSTPVSLAAADWHTPLVADEDWEQLIVADPTHPQLVIERGTKTSAGRCARVSHLTHDGRRDIGADVALAEKLVGDGHMSPLEHAARPMTELERQVLRRFEIRDVAAALQPWEAVSEDLTDFGGAELQDLGKHVVDCGAWCGNFRGWVQMRKEVPGEADFSLAVGHGR